MGLLTNKVQVALKNDGKAAKAVTPPQNQSSIRLKHRAGSGSSPARVRCRSAAVEAAPENRFVKPARKQKRQRHRIHGMRGGKAQRLRIDVDEPFDGGPRTRNGQLQHVGRALAHDQQNNNHSKKAQKAGAVQPVIQYGKNNYGNQVLRRQVADFFAECRQPRRVQ